MKKLKYFEGMKMMNGMMNMNGSIKSMGAMKMSNQKMDMNTNMYPEITDSKKQNNVNIEKPDMNQNATAKMDDMNMLEMKKADKIMPMVTLDYGMLKSTVPTSLPPGPTKVIKFQLTGNMLRYIWTINNRTVSESEKIRIKRGENIRIILHNSSMMRHPMHLHGHFFRVLNANGDYSMPMETDTIEFAATESGDWYFHCHILYHMMSGMGRIFSYENSPLNTDLGDSTAALKKVYADDRRFWPNAHVSLESTGSDGRIGLVNTRWAFTST